MAPFSDENVVPVLSGSLLSAVTVTLFSCLWRVNS